MISVVLEYKPFGFLWKRKLEAKLPTRWSELTPLQISSIPDLQRDKLDEIKLLEIFLGLKRKIARKVDSYQRYCILRNLKYISQPEPVGSFIIKSIAGLEAPEKNLKGVTFGAFIFGDTYYQNYINGKKEDLNRFIACYYLKEGKFDDRQIEANARIISKVDLSIREAIVINYALIREWMARAYPYVFRKAEGGKKVENSKGWVAIFDMVVGDDIVNENKYAEKPLSIMLRYLNRKTKEYYKNGSRVQ